MQCVFHPVAVVGKLAKNRKETAKHKRRNNKQNNTKSQLKTNVQNKKINIKRILKKPKSSN